MQIEAYIFFKDGLRVFFDAKNYLGSEPINNIEFELLRRFSSQGDFAVMFLLGDLSPDLKKKKVVVYDPSEKVEATRIATIRDAKRHPDYPGVITLKV